MKKGTTVTQYNHFKNSTKNDLAQRRKKNWEPAKKKFVYFLTILGTIWFL